mmetsp:Transcript_11578/g.17505  ORF Transcript_11578/g.17505 Transcript_11578/m.17505 type:complete len:118 (+) Transcript_11578:116-469(+)
MNLDQLTQSIDNQARSHSKADTKASSKSNEKSSVKVQTKTGSKVEAKTAAKDKEDKQKTITEIAGGDSMDLHVTKKILEDAAEMIKSSETDDLDELNLTTGGDHAGDDKKKKEQAAA